MLEENTLDIESARTETDFSIPENQPAKKPRGQPIAAGRIVIDKENFKQLIFDEIIARENSLIVDDIKQEIGLKGTYLNNLLSDKSSNRTISQSTLDKLFALYQKVLNGEIQGSRKPRGKKAPENSLAIDKENFRQLIIEEIIARENSLTVDDIAKEIDLKRTHLASLLSDKCLRHRYINQSTMDKLCTLYQKILNREVKGSRKSPRGIILDKENLRQLIFDEIIARENSLTVADIAQVIGLKHSDLTNLLDNNKSSCTTPESAIDNLCALYQEVLKGEVTGSRKRPRSRPIAGVRVDIDKANFRQLIFDEMIGCENTLTVDDIAQEIGLKGTYLNNLLSNKSSNRTISQSVLDKLCALYQKVLKGEVKGLRKLSGRKKQFQSA